MENYENQNPQPRRKRKTQEEKWAVLQERKKKLLAQESKLKQKATNERRKNRSNTFYAFGGELFSDKWEVLRKILIDDKSWQKITVYIDDKLFAEKSKNQEV